MESKSTDVDGIRMRWEEEGDGQPIIFLHGIPTSPALWRHVVPEIRSGRSLAWEMVGYGGSMAEGRDRDISLARQADYLRSWMRKIDLDSAILVGHDLGGGVAQILASRYPERVSGLVFTNSVAYDNWPVPSVQMLRRWSGIVERLPGLLLRGIIATLMRRGHDTSERAKEALEVHWAHYSEYDDASAAFVRQIQSLDVEDTLGVADRIPSLDIPARVVWGAADDFLTIDYGRRLARDLGAEVDEIDDGKHFIPEDEPKRVAAAVNDLAEDLRRMPG